MAGAQQISFMNQRSFGPGTPTVIGQAYEGGFWAGDLSTTNNGVATHHLVVAPLSSGETTNLMKTSRTATSNPGGEVNGNLNTDAMIAASPTDHPCANFANNAVIGGFSDWYIPAKNELAICYFNLKPGTTSNNTGFFNGVNDSSVPTRTTAFTAGNPAQTSAAAFQTGGANPFNTINYWSSTQGAGIYGQIRNFNDGVDALSYKNVSRPMRCIRRVPV